MQPLEAARMQVLPGVGPVPPLTPPPILSSSSTSCPACCSVQDSVLTHGHASLGPRNRPWFGAKPAPSLELEPATQGSQELAHLGLGSKLWAVGSSARLASVSVPHRLLEQHSRVFCRACKGKLWRETIPRLLCSALLRPPLCCCLCGF